MVGNKTNYEPIDVLRVFLRICIREDKKSREMISYETSIGEGSIKSILCILKSKKLISSSKKGHYLSIKGKALQENIMTFISPILKIDLDIFDGIPGKAIQIKKPTKPVTYKARDIAIRCGAEAAVLFKYEGKLILPQCDQDIIDTRNIEKVFDLWDGDYLVIAYAKDSEIIERALLKVSIDLNDGLNRFIRSNLFENI